MFMTFVAITLIVISVCLSVKKPIVFVAFYGIFAAPYEACGIAGYLNMSFPYYQIIMDYLLLVVTIYHICRLIKRHRIKWGAYILIGVVLLVGVAMSIVVTYATTGTNIFTNFAWPFTNFMPLALFIMMDNQKDENIVNIFNTYLRIEIILAFLIVYLPTVGVHMLDVLSAANYVSDGYIYNHNIADFSNFFLAFSQKYLFNGLGQFHNANGMGFFGGLGMFWFAFQMAKKGKFICKIINGICFIMSLMLWCNAGTRGVIIGIIIGFVIFFIAGEKGRKAKLNVLLIIAAALVLLTTIPEIKEYIFVSNNNISVTSRSNFRLNGFNYLQDNWLIGAGGLLSTLTYMGIDPHELPLRIACLFGIVPGILATILFYIIPVKDWLLSKNKTLIACVFYSVFMFITLSNNYTCIILAQFILAISLYDLNIEESAKSVEVNNI